MHFAILLIVAIQGALCATFNPVEATISDEAILNGVSCTEIVQQYLDRIGKYDKAGPMLNTVINLVPDATSTAMVKDEELRVLGTKVLEIEPLFCVPLIVKDNYNVVNVPTTAGSLSLKNSVPTIDCDVISRLRNAGVVFLAKVNMAEFAADGLNTNSSMGGQTLNAYDLNRTPYGSSGGSAVAIAASFGVGGVGTDTDGSLINPASGSSVVSIRSTQGLVRGILPLVIQQDVAGPMCRTVTDAAKMLTVIVEEQFAKNYTEFLDKDGLKGARIGYVKEFLSSVKDPLIIPSAEVIELANGTVAELQQLGATVQDISIFAELFNLITTASDNATACGFMSFKYYLNAYLRALGPKAPMKSLSDIVASGEYGQNVAQFLYAANQTNGDPQVSPICRSYLKAKTAMAQYLTKILDGNNLDAIMFPNANQPPPLLSQLKPTPPGWFSSVIVSAFSGLPSINVPMGYTSVSKAPMGMTFLGRAYQEGTLIRIAYAYEQATHWRKPPASTS